MSRHERRGAVAKNPAKKQPSPVAMRREGDLTSVTIETWRLPAPEREYYADLCIVTTGSGTPILHLGQVGPSGKLISAVSVVMGRGDLMRMVDAFRPVFEAIESRLETGISGNVQLADSTTMLSEIAPERYFKFLASIVRGGCDSEFAMLDFYSRDLLIEQRLSSGEPLDVRPCLRVRMTPELLAELFSRLAAGG